MALFRNCLDTCNLIDVGYVGPKFTWSNKQDAQCNTRVRLDRGVANVAFSDLFGDCSVENVITSSSYHYAIHITLTKNLPGRDGPPDQTGFCYEAAWRRAEDYSAVVETGWARNSIGTNRIQNTFGLEQFESAGGQVERLEQSLVRVCSPRDQEAGACLVYSASGSYPRG
ncbi:hypothetical protein ZWY2020_024214 [Hordeum vulgare]|nr:hypothetical protein ZWY2020_024214 [Hordeum vulgare]